ncbi:MAG: hypothetical protein JSV92_03580 [archaeon]|nr:MAG: hypothetical protein JSV92_03580 [archaeon]
MLDKGLVFYIGCALVPSPPSPCFDFGLQFLVVILIGAVAPHFFIRPVNSALFVLGRFFRNFFGRIPGLRVVVEKVYQFYKKWEMIMEKKRKPKNKYLAKIIGLIVKGDFLQRLVFGYFMTVILGLVLMLAAIFLL